jgi:NitT/TauT family transport system substrate-binding protein
MATPARRILLPLVVLTSMLVSACGFAPEPSAGRIVLRLGYFPNITHATALVGIHDDIFAKHLGGAVELHTSVFKSGGEAVSALFAGAVDASYIGATPAVNGFAKSGGRALQIVSGATSGGAFLVVRAGVGVGSANALRGKRIATPSLGNTQDVALRAWLREQGLAADESGGGDVSIVPQDNATTLAAFKAGDIDGAWLPEPWATRLIEEAHAKVLVDERDLWPGGKFVTTQLVVATSFLDAHPDIVKHLLEGQVAANDFVNASPVAAQAAANEQIEAVTGKHLPAAVIADAWRNLTFTNDPIPSSLVSAASAATTFGFIAPVDLRGIYQLDPLNAVLAAAGEPTVKGL